MQTKIHPLAYVDPKAQLGVDVEVGPFAYVGEGVILGDRTKLHHHAAVEGNTVLGVDCEVFPFANIGGKTQDLKYDGSRTGVRIGDRNTFREYVTVHTGTKIEECTQVGHDNLFLSSAHIAHDCIIHNHIIVSGGAMLAGHIEVFDYAIIGGASAIHQFCRVGSYAMVGGVSAVTKDIAPFTIASGNLAEIHAINKIGLERNGFTQEQISTVKQIFRIVFRSGLNLTQALEKLSQTPELQGKELDMFLDFVKNSTRGITT